MFVIQLINEEKDSYWLKDYLFSPGREMTEIHPKLNKAFQFETLSQAEATAAYLEIIDKQWEIVHVCEFILDPAY